jgi:hypothetical protein
MKMLLIVAFLAFSATLIAGEGESSYSDCVPTVYTPISSSIVSILTSASYYYPSIYTIGSELSTLELSSPSLYTAETTIESYEPYYSSVISEIESMYSYPALYTDLSYVSEFTEAYSSLANAVSIIESIEMTQSGLAQYQSSLQSLETVYTSILTDLSLYTGFEYPSVYTAAYVISEATLTDSSALASLIEIDTLISTSPTVSSAVNDLSASLYTLPYSVVTEIISWFSSPSTVGSSTLSSLYICNSAAYYEQKDINQWIYSHPYYTSMMPEFACWAGSAYYVSSLLTEASIIISYQMPTFSYDVSVLTAAASTQPAITNDLSILTYIEAESPSIYQAEKTIEATFYNSPSIAYSISYAINYPSLVTDPSSIQYFEESHESFVSAILCIDSWGSYYTSSASMLSSIESQLTTAFVNYGTLLTAYSYVQDVTSPSLAIATAYISAVKSSVSDLTYILTQMSYVISQLPSLSCYESDEEYYAEAYPYVASYVWDVIDSIVYLPSSSVSYFESLTASYSSLAYDDYMIVGGQIDYSFLYSLESSFIYAAETDSSLLTQYEELSSMSTIAYTAWSSTVSTVTVC